ncbi:MAG: biotin transporter BioY [Spirochaetes bacterium]|nr:MAG: biotin transporter BioY [Spirochaetota bacterium]
MIISKAQHRIPARSESNGFIHTLILKLALYSLIFAFFTGVSSKIRFFLPFTPVPITGQVFMVLLSGIILGPEFGSLSQMLYVFLGISGIPWFTLGSLFGPTGGYLIGFVVAPYIVGIINKKGIFNLVVALIAGVSVIYLFGALQFSLIMGTGFIKTIKLAVLPFIPFDILKSQLIILTVPLYKTIVKQV